MLINERSLDAFTIRSQLAAFPPPPEPSARTYGISEILQILWRYRRFLTIFVAIGTFLSLIVSLSLTEQYAATSAIVFDRNDTRPYEAVVEAQKQERDKSAMETELDVIRSRVFVGIVVDALKLAEDPYYNTYLPAPEVGDNTWLRARWSALMQLVGGKTASGRETPTTRIISESAQRDRAITTLLSTFTVDRKGDSLAMSIKVMQPNPVQAAAIANAIAEHYVSWTSGLKATATKDTVKYLRKQADDLAISIANQERRIATFTATSDLTFDPKDDLLRARMEQLNEQFTLARVEESGAWAKVNEAKERLARSGEDGIGKVFSSELLTNLRTEEGRLQRLRGQLTSKFGDNHPLVVDADAELASNRKMIMDEASRMLQELENNAEISTIRVKNFDHEVALLQKRIQARNLAEIRRRELERDLLSEQKTYDQIQLRLSQLDPEQQEVKATATVASFAEVPVQPSFPQPAFIVAAGLVGSAILAILFMIVLDGLDDRIHRPEEISGILNRPNLIVLPDYRKAKGSKADPYKSLLQNPKSHFTNSIRSLSLAWRTIDSSTGGKVVMFTSTSKGDGKTTLALSLAAMAKMNGLRVVFVDLSPSEGGAASICGVQLLSDNLVADFLAGKGELSDIVTASPSYPFLDVIDARPSALDYERLFSSLRGQYDITLVDTPAMEEADDAIWLSAHVDSIFVLAVPEKTKRKALIEMVERFNLNHALLVGSITNFCGKAKEWRNPFGRIKPMSAAISRLARIAKG